MPIFTRTVALAAALTAFAGGCQSARVAEPLTRTVGSNDQQIDFWHGLAVRPVTSYDEAFHGLLMFLRGDDPADDYAGRVATLKSSGLLPAGFAQPADQAVDRGTLAVALAKALQVRGGLAMRVLGPTPRYAVRELQYLDVFPPSSPNQTFSGAEFLGIIAKAEEYQHVPTRGSGSSVGTKTEPLRGALPGPTTEPAQSVPAEAGPAQVGPGAAPYPPRPSTPTPPQSPNK